MNPLPMTVLLAIDGSKESELASRTAVAISKRMRSELHVVCVANLGVAADPRLLGGLQQRMRGLLDEQVRVIRESGGTVADDHLAVGRPDQQIIALAEELEANLIVMGNRGLGGVRRALMGSVSDSVVRHAHCPVLIVRSKPVVFPTKILVATDGSAKATLAAKRAADLATKSGSELHVLTVAPDIREFDRLVGKRPAGSYVETHKALEKETRRILEEQAKKIREADGTVEEIHLEMGEPPDRAIVYLGEYIDAGLIVMGSRGHGGVRKMLMGSVSDSVVRHAHCPVMIVREEKGGTTAHG